MALIKCPECGKEISDMANSCPHCGRPIVAKQNTNQKTNSIPNNPRKRKKGHGCLLFFIFFFLLMVGLGIAVSRGVEDMENNTEKSEDSIDIIEDVEQFSRISVNELKNIMGNPASEESWTNKTSKGNFNVTTFSYDKNLNHYEFIVTEDSVVRLTIYSNNYWNNKGNRFSITKSKKDIYKAFNITLGKNAKKVVDNNFSYILSPVNDKIAKFDVQDINSDTYGFVKITYNLNYFD